MVNHSDALQTPGDTRYSVVLLGASNLARGVSTVVDTARQICVGPVDIYTALGHGRSYGQSSSVLGRRLPGILQSGIWSDLAAREHQQVLALVTDIGNDLLFGAPVETIAGWVEECLERLAALDAKIVVTSLPIETLNKLTVARFRLFRSLLFPQNRYDLATALEHAAQLNAAVERIGKRRNAHLVAPSPAWYGFDPIHLKLSVWRHAWPTILAPLNPRPNRSPIVHGSLTRWLYLRTRTPAQRSLFGWRQGRLQPSARLSDGTTIAAY